MYKKLFLFVLLILAGIASYAQTISISGSIRDKETKETIPFCSLYLKKTGIYSMSNTNGDFIFKIPASCIGDTISILFLGYAPTKITVPKRDSILSIKLEKDLHVLPEVTIKPLGVNEIVAKIISNIPKNYPARTSAQAGFFRESLSLADSRIQVNEGVIEVYKNSYAALDTSKVKIIKARSAKDSSEHSKSIRIGGALNTAAVESDIVKQRISFLNKEQIKNYKYSLASTLTDPEGKSLYVINFKPAGKEAFFQGRLYADIHTFALVSADYELSKAAMRRGKSMGQKRQSYQCHVSYMYVNKHYQLKSSLLKAVIRHREIREKVYLTVAYTTTQVLSIPAGDKTYRTLPASTERIFKANIGKYDKHFWENYNIIQEER